MIKHSAITLLLICISLTAWSSSRGSSSHQRGAMSDEFVFNAAAYPVEPAKAPEVSSAKKEVKTPKILPNVKNSLKDIKKKVSTKKEKDPRLVTALLLTIFGGLAVLMGVLLINVWPTELFIFAFGIMFIVGVVSLIRYLANPKPKM